MKRTITTNDWAQLLKPIEVEITEGDCCFIARFPEANCYAVGCSEADALENLNDVVAARMEMLSSRPGGRVTNLQLAVLRECVVAH